MSKVWICEERKQFERFANVIVGRVKNLFYAKNQNDDHPFGSSRDEQVFPLHRCLLVFQGCDTRAQTVWNAGSRGSAVWWFFIGL